MFEVTVEDAAGARRRFTVPAAFQTLVGRLRTIEMTDYEAETRSSFKPS
jgi:hypothetical protein